MLEDVIPYLVPRLPRPRKRARFNVKRPTVHTSVALRNWRSFHKLGVSHINTPGMYHSEVSLAEAVSLGGLKHPQSPDEPIVVHMERTPCVPGQPIKIQHRLGRAELSPLLSRRSSEASASSSRECSDPAASTPRTTYLPSPSIAGHTATRIRTTVLRSYGLGFYLEPHPA